MAGTPAITQEQFGSLVDSDQATDRRAPRDSSRSVPRADVGTVTASWDPYDIWLNRVQKPRREQQRLAAGRTPTR